MILYTLEDGAIVKREVGTPTFDRSCEVLVVGAGCAGVYAADAAASMGARVILCEIGENIGGMHVQGSVIGYYYGAPGGSFEKDDKRDEQDRLFTEGKHSELKQVRMLRRLRASGVELLCRHSATGLYFEDGRVVGIRAFDGERSLSISAKITVDATSDGHLVRMTDVKKLYGRPGEGSFVPFGVFVNHTKDGKLCYANNDSGIIDHYNAEEFTRGALNSHAELLKPREGVEHLRLANHVGIREGLTYEGEDAVRYGDLLLGKQPRQVLFYAYSDLDRHGFLRASEEELFKNWWVVSNLSTVIISIPVPMGAVVPRGIGGLVTAGRCISCDSYSQSAVRMNRDMFRMGECVGVAAALAVRDGVDFLNIDMEEYLSTVEKRGCYAGYSERGFCFDDSYSMYLNKMNSLGREPDKKYAHLKPSGRVTVPISFGARENLYRLTTDAPGVALWSCYLEREDGALRDEVYRLLLGAEDRLSRCNYAIALGIMEDGRGLPVLREIVKNRDCFFFTDNRRTNQFRTAVAACLIGRLGTGEDLDPLWEILSPEEIGRDMYHTLRPDYLYYKPDDRNFVYFSVMTHAAMAIYEIWRREGMAMEELHRRFEEAFADGELLRAVTTAKEGSPAYEETAGFLAHMLRLTEQP